MAGVPEGVSEIERIPLGLSGVLLPQRLKFNLLTHPAGVNTVVRQTVCFASTWQLEVYLGISSIGPPIFVSP